MKRRPSARLESEEENNGDEDDGSNASSSAFWQTSANAVESDDSSELTTFQDAVKWPDQVHWREAIRAELNSMQLRGMFQAANLPTGQHVIGKPSGCSRSSAKPTDRLRNTRHV